MSNFTLCYGDHQSSRSLEVMVILDYMRHWTKRKIMESFIFTVAFKTNKKESFTQNYA